MKKITFLFLALCMVSCMNDQTKTNDNLNSGNTKTTKKKNPKQLVLEIDLEMSKPEDIKLSAVKTFLNNGQYIDIHISQKINTNELAKSIRFALPENITPDNTVSISFGTKTVKEVKINNIKLSFDDLNYNIDSDRIMEFFKTNQFVDYDEKTKVFKTKRVDGKHNPKLILRNLYVEKIEGIR